MAIVIKKTGKAEYGQYVKAFIYGPPGSGKTLFSSTAKDVIIGNIDEGLMTLAERGVDYTDIQHPEDLHELLMHLRQPNHGYKTVVIDTLDELQKVFIAARLKKERKEQMALQDWGYLGEQMQKVLRAYRNLPMNVIFLCHSTTETDNENGGMAEKPLLQGSIKDNVAGFFDLVAHIQATTTKDGEELVTSHHLRFQPSPRYPILKDRSGKMPGFYKLNLETDFEDIHELIYGGIDKLTESEIVKTIEIEPPVEAPATPPVAPVSVTPPAKKTAAKKTTPSKKETVEALKAEATGPVDPHAPVSRSVKVVPAAEREQEALELLKTQLSAKDVNAPTVFTCAECNAEVDEDLADLSKIRHRKVLCQTHFASAKKNK